MTNAEKFKKIFGLYATELWAKPEDEFLKWLNEDVPDINDEKWIPVGERLPEEAVQVLVTDDAGGFATIDVDYGYFDKEYGRFEWFHSQNVTAWRPLPEPWKGAKNETN